MVPTWQRKNLLGKKHNQAEDLGRRRRRRRRKKNLIKDKRSKNFSQTYIIFPTTVGGAILRAKFHLENTREPTLGLQPRGEASWSKPAEFMLFFRWRATQPNRDLPWLFVWFFSSSNIEQVMRGDLQYWTEE